ncbi:MAG: hypothetical protein HFE77_07420 [Clostridiales bacterium]|nr:hypothetical protein [Clostridiales bacterium]
MKKILLLLLSLVLLISAVSCQKAGNESESETIVTTEPDFVMPEQSYIGIWYTKSEGVPGNPIFIYEITEDTVRFDTGIRDRHFGLQGTAIVRDGALVFGDGISPDYSGPSQLKGRLEFADNHVTVIYESFGDIEANQMEPNTYDFTVKNEDSDVLLARFKNEAVPTVPPLSYPARAEPALESAMKTVIDDMLNKGWQQIEVIESEPDTIRRWGGIVLDPCVLQDGEVLYTVIGRSENVLCRYDGVYAVVKIAYHYGSEAWRRAETYYISSSGRQLPEADFESQFSSAYQVGKVVFANHPVLFDYMYGY